MKMLRAVVLSVWVFAGLHGGPLFSQETSAARVQSFTPQGESKQVRQVVARFSAPMVAFGDPRLESPFDVQCAALGRGHWIDANSWVYDFDADLPAGLTCRFTTKPGFKSLGAAGLEQQQFAFSTGGPAVVSSLPEDGMEDIDEEQIFLLGLDAPADIASIKQHAACRITGIGDRIPLEIIEGSKREKILAEQRPRASHFFRVLTEHARTVVLEVKDGRLKDAPVVVAKCGRRLPAGSEVSLLWEKGVASVSGIASSADQVLHFAVRPAFTARTICTRINPNAGCVPISPVTVQFSAPVARDLAKKILLRTEDGKTMQPQLDEEDGKTVESVVFAGPFSARSEVMITLPAKFRDDADRELENATLFPLKVRIDDDPPLIKFPSRFGILESHAQPALPVSVRNIASMAPGQGQLVQPQAAHGVMARLDTDDDAVLADWFRRVTRHPAYEEGGAADRFLKQHERYPREGELPLLMGQDNPPELHMAPLSLPAVHGKALELIGIPLKKPGYYMVEFASDRLGAALHAEQKPYYVSSSALVTNMAVHLKHGRESSLVWVTSLDNAHPVKGAKVRVSTCNGKALWEGKTDSAGMAHIDTELDEGYASSCYGLLVTARKGDDMSFTLSSWDQGISPWQFNLGGGASASEIMAHTVFDRPLFRADETVSMKHFVRVPTGKGFSLPDHLPNTATVTHDGSGEQYEVPVQWSATAGVSSWKIPKEAKLGTYSVSLMVKPYLLDAGSFRVEQYRVPLMKAVLKAPERPLINGRELAIDAQLNYLAGGAAAGAQVKFRSRLVRHDLSFSGYDDFTFGGSTPKEGIEAVQPYSYDPEEDELESGDETDQAIGYPVRTVSMVLDADGGARVAFDNIPKVEEPRALEVEMEYSDPNGQILNASTRAMVLPSALALGIKHEGGIATRDNLSFKVVALDSSGKAVANRKVDVEAYSRKTFAYRKRMLGGFYAYEQTAEVKRIGSVCRGKTDAYGLLQCRGAAPDSGELILLARASDEQGNTAIASSEFYVSDDDHWFDASQSDRIDVLADKHDYMPGETARFEVRMPFREATALVTVEREGILDSFVVPVSAKSPFVEVPIAENYGPNAYVSVMVVRGRIDPEAPGPFAWLKRMVYQVGKLLGIVKQLPKEVVDTRPTALVDLTKPAFKLGITQIRVGRQAYELKVQVEPEHRTYHPRDKARVKVTVQDSSGKPAANAEVALAAVDEGLLQLARPASWDLLDAMMQRRPIEVHTATAQSQVIGKRHFGKKAAAPGGGGGQGANARELFDTLLLWKPTVMLDQHGQATLEVPLNDALTTFRIAAIAHAGAAQFGSATATISSSQDVMLFAGLPPFVREGDQFSAMVTVRNGGTRPLTLDVTADAGLQPAETRQVSLPAGEGATVAFPVRVPVDIRQLDWKISAKEAVQGAAQDVLHVSQAVGAAYPVRVYQHTMEQLEPGRDWSFPVQKPAGALPGRGGLDIRMNKSLVGDLGAVREWVTRYPYISIEQRASVAVVLENETRWNTVMNSLTRHLDRDGLVKHFPMEWLEGDDSLTAYLLAIADETNYLVPDTARERMLKGLEDFVSGRIHRYGRLQAADLVMRKLAAIDALARYGRATPGMLTTLEITPDLWPSSGIIDWASLLTRMQDVPGREQKLEQALRILRSRLMFSGSTMSFSTEKQDYLWWLMVSPDVNAVRALRLLLDDAEFSAADAGRLARGALGRQLGGHWQTTLANAWGVVALRHFRERYERDAVQGTTRVALGEQATSLDWEHARAKQHLDPVAGTAPGAGLETHFAWPDTSQVLSLHHAGSGKPWAFVTSRAALPLEKPLFAGYGIRRTVTAVEQKTPGAWQRGDSYRVRLDIDAQTDMTWVVVNDPVPAGATILGSGLGGDSGQLTAGEKQAGWQRPAFEERAVDAFRAYYAYVPKGKFSIEYTVRLNNAGHFEMPATRVEAIYAPEIFGELPVAKMEVKAE